MQLAVESESLLASLALSPPLHTHADSSEHAERTSTGGGGESRYHAHVLHQIAVAATPRRATAAAAAAAAARASKIDAQPASSTAATSSLTLPDDADIEFHMDESDMSLDSPANPGLGLPLAHMHVTQKLASPSDVLAQISAEDDERPHPQQVPPPPRLQHLSVENDVHQLGSPAYIMSPATHAEFRAHMSSTYDILLSPLPAEKDQHEETSESSESAASTATAATAAADAARSVLLRQRIIEELLSSERSYLQSLDNLLKYFVHPLRASLTAPLTIPGVTVTKAQQDTLFGQVELIAQFNSKLYAELGEAVNALPAGMSHAQWYGEGGPAIGAMFLQFAPFLRMYTSYVTNHEAAGAMLKTLEKENSKFAQWCAKQAQASGQTLASYLIGPIQRVPRYSLLLQELLRKTPVSHPDCAALTRSLSLVNHAASHINESVRAAENRAQILAIQERFGGSSVVSLVEPGRWFVRQGPLTKQGRHSDVEYVFILFSNVLLYASVTTLGKLKLHRSIPLDASFHFASLGDEDSGAAAEFSLSGIATPGPGLTSPPSEGMRKDSADVEQMQVRSPSTAIESALTPVAAAPSTAAAAAAPPSSSDPSLPAHRFRIESRERSFDVYAKTAQIKADWLRDLAAVTMQIKLHENQRNENVALALAASNAGGAGGVDGHGHSRSASRSNSISLPAGAPALLQVPSATSASGGPMVFGRVQPVMEQCKSTSVCTVCSKLCTSFSGRRHCQACGHIACSKCCRTELMLDWCRKEARVCDRCVEKCKTYKIQQQQARRASIDAGEGGAAAAGTAGAPPLPARPAHGHSASFGSGAALSAAAVSSSHPSRPSRPSKDTVSQLLSSSSSASSGTSSSSSRPHQGSLDVNSDDEVDDAAGVLSPTHVRKSSKG